MTKSQAIKEFTTFNKPFREYWEMQLAWTIFLDSLKADKRITQRQRDCVWGNPCTPETFKTFNRKFKG